MRIRGNITQFIISWKILKHARHVRLNDHFQLFPLRNVLNGEVIAMQGPPGHMQHMQVPPGEHWGVRCHVCLRFELMFIHRTNCITVPVNQSR